MRGLIKVIIEIKNGIKEISFERKIVLTLKKNIKLKRIFKR